MNRIQSFCHSSLLSLPLPCCISPLSSLFLHILFLFFSIASFNDHTLIQEFSLTLFILINQHVSTFLSLSAFRVPLVEGKRARYRHAQHLGWFMQQTNPRLDDGLSLLKLCNYELYFSLRRLVRKYTIQQSEISIYEVD